LIDEVHMLSNHSFNALLKTLEEPPPHVKFLLATTDPQKLPVTVLSRCLQFNLKRMPVELISGHLKYLTEQETIAADELSLKLIARAADGSMRDALSLLDQSIAFGNGELKETDVREMLGTISQEPLIALLKAVSAGEGAEIIRQIDDMASITPDFEAATDALIATLHQIAVQQVVPDAMLDDESVSELAAQLTKEDVQLYYQIALHGRRDLPLSPDPRSGFEMILLRMLAFRPMQEGMVINNQAGDQNVNKVKDNKQNNSKKKTVASEPELVARQSQAREIEKALVANDNRQQKVAEAAPPKKPSPDALSAKASSPSMNQSTNTIDDVPWETLPEELTEPVKNTASNSVNNSAIIPEKKNNVATERANNKPFIQSTPVDSSAPSKPVDKNAEWHEIVPALKLKGRAAELIKHCLFAGKENGIISLTLDQSSEGLLADSIKQEIKTALVAFYGESLDLKLQVADDNSNTVDATISAAQETPAQRTARNTIENQQQAEHNIATDPFVIELQNRFGALIVPGSVQIK